MINKKIILWGGTGQAKVIYEAIDNNLMKVIAIVDNKKLEKSPIRGVSLLYGMEELSAFLKNMDKIDYPYFIVTIGGKHGKDRLELIQNLRSLGLRALSIVHKTAFIAKDSFIDECSQVLAMAAICSNVRLGKGVIINTSASVDHDCIIGDGVHVAPGARLAGEIIVKDRVFIGTGAIILPGLHIGEDAIVGAGAVVTKDVQARTVVVGTPAYILHTDKVNNRRGLNEFNQTI